MFRLMAFANRILSVFVKVVSSNTVSNTFHKRLTLLLDTMNAELYHMCDIRGKSNRYMTVAMRLRLHFAYTHVSYIPFILKHTSEQHCEHAKNCVFFFYFFFSPFGFPNRLIQLVHFG